MFVLLQHSKQLRDISGGRTWPADLAEDPVVPHLAPTNSEECVGCQAVDATFKMQEVLTALQDPAAGSQTC